MLKRHKEVLDKVVSTLIWACLIKTRKFGATAQVLGAAHILRNH